jgi:hypothetical protein
LTEFFRKSSHRAGSRYESRSLRMLFLWVSTFLLLASASSGDAKPGGVQDWTAGSAGPGLTIAIADFDGDHRPDLASIQPGQSAFGTSTYWVQFQLSAAGRQSLQLVAPAGGLRIEARDVNGDHAVDLVFTTAWLREPVAILLNNGQGGFSRAELAAFPGVFGDAGTKLVSGTRLGADHVGLLRHSRVGIEEAITGPFQGCLAAGATLSSSPGFPVECFLFFSAGRAPPLLVFHL